MKKQNQIYTIPTSTDARGGKQLNNKNIEEVSFMEKREQVLRGLQATITATWRIQYAEFLINASTFSFRIYLYLTLAKEISNQIN